MIVVALVSDLMDRSKISAAFPSATIVRDPSAVAGADLVIIDLARFGDEVGAAREAAPTARIVGYGPHVDTDGAAAAMAAGADAAVPRSRFFHDPVAAATSA